MRAREFLIEYDRTKTAQALGDSLIAAVSKDSYSSRLLNDISMLKMMTSDTERSQKKYKIVNDVLAIIEEKDPTPNKEYTQWLARMYAKGGIKLEDLNRGALIALYNLGKKRRMIKPEHADINRFKTYKEFEDTMLQQYELDDIENVGDKKAEDKGEAKTVFDNDQVRIVVPENAAAACYYGRGTRWCTAATRGDNRFDSYNHQGKLYILIPKKPTHPGEKYQLHFQSGSCMDENDESVNIMNILTKRFGDLVPLFMEKEPAVQDSIIFADDSVLEDVIEKVSDIASEQIWDIMNNWEHDDDYYYKEMLDKYGDKEGDIDWDAAHRAGDDYLNWNPGARDFVSKLEELIKPSSQRLKKWTEEAEAAGDIDGLAPITSVADIISDIVSSSIGAGVMSKFLKWNIYIKKSKDGTWKVDYIAPTKKVRETAYAGGMGQGGNAGQSYRKFKPKVAGTFKEDSDMRFAAEKTPAVNPYGGQKDRQFRGSINEQPKKVIKKESSVMKGLRR